MRRVMRRFLDKTGYIIFEAGDGEEALRLAARERPDVILLDVQIPLLDGYGVLASLQTDPELSEIPVVLVTARSEPEDVADGLHRGAHDYLRKPFQQPELLARVHAAMRTKALRDELRARNAQLELMVSTDLVTGLLNRRATDEQLGSLVSRSRRHAADAVRPAHRRRRLPRDQRRARQRRRRRGAARPSRCASARSCARRTASGAGAATRCSSSRPTPGPEGAASLAARISDAVAAGPVRTEAGAISARVSVGAVTLEPDDDAETVVRRAERALRGRARAGLTPARGGASSHRGSPRFPRTSDRRSDARARAMREGPGHTRRGHGRRFGVHSFRRGDRGEGMTQTLEGSPALLRPLERRAPVHRGGTAGRAAVRVGQASGVRGAAPVAVVRPAAPLGTSIGRAAGRGRPVGVARGRRQPRLPHGHVPRRHRPRGPRAARRGRRRRGRAAGDRRARARRRHPRPAHARPERHQRPAPAARTGPAAARAACS